jgi:hypothetical protein
MIDGEKGLSLPMCYMFALFVCHPRAEGHPQQAILKIPAVDYTHEGEAGMIPVGYMCQGSPLTPYTDVCTERIRLCYNFTNK